MASNYYSKRQAYFKNIYYRITINDDNEYVSDLIWIPERKSFIFDFLSSYIKIIFNIRLSLVFLRSNPKLLVNVIVTNKNMQQVTGLNLKTNNINLNIQTFKRDLWSICLKSNL